MISSQFVIEDIRELRALHRVFREAKFCAEADDSEISTSPLVAALHEKLLTILVSLEEKLGDNEARKRWDAWRMIDETRDEWAAAVRRAKEDREWCLLSEEDRREYVRILLSPFYVDSSVYQKFVRAVQL